VAGPEGGPAPGSIAARAREVPVPRTQCCCQQGGSCEGCCSRLLATQRASDPHHPSTLALNPHHPSTCPGSLAQGAEAELQELQHLAAMLEREVAVREAEEADVQAMKAHVLQEYRLVSGKEHRLVGGGREVQAP